MNRKIVGVIVSAFLFVLWILVDLTLFPLIGAETNYPLYEIVAYGSWFLVTLVILVVVSWSGLIPARYQKVDS